MTDTLRLLWFWMVKPAKNKLVAVPTILGGGVYWKLLK